LVFFFSPEGVGLCLPGTCFNIKMWPLLALQLNLEVLMFRTGGDGHWGGYHLNLGDLCWYRKQ
jgi:hypothetical protein